VPLGNDAMTRGRLKLPSLGCRWRPESLEDKDRNRPLASVRILGAAQGPCTS